MDAVTTRLAEPIARLVRLAVEGDELAFARIVAAHQGDLARVCFVICGDQDLADEAVQGAWLIAWRKLGLLRDPDRLRSWLIAIASNQARDLMRRQRRRHVVELAIAEHSDRGASEAAREHDIDLRNALARLQPDDRALLALRYIAGLDSFELADAFGLSASGTRARLSRLLGRLREELSDG